MAERFFGQFLFTFISQLSVNDNLKMFSWNNGEGRMIFQ